MPDCRSLKTELRFAAVVALWLLACAAGCRDRPGPVGERAESATAGAKSQNQADKKSTTAPASADPTVELVIDYDDGVEKRFPAIAWRANMTVLDVLDAAKDRPHGIAFSVRGRGETALLTKLDDVANQEGSTDAKDWIFFVNERMADRGLGVVTVKSGDVILWKFQRYEYNGG